MKKDLLKYFLSCKHILKINNNIIELIVQILQIILKITQKSKIIQITTLIIKEGIFVDLAQRIKSLPTKKEVSLRNLNKTNCQPNSIDCINKPKINYKMPNYS